MKFSILRFIAILSSVFLYLTAAHAVGDLMLFPTRIVFDKNRKSAQIDLTNTGTESSSYRITLQNKRMTETGEFQDAKTALKGELFADSFVQFSPRQVELKPGNGQVIRVILRKPADLPPGEYRTHMVFNRLPDAKPPVLDTNQASEKELGISITPLIGVSIPIIIQNGETTVESSMSGLKLFKGKKEDPPVLEMRLERSGNRSLYGDIIIKYVSKSGTEQNLANIKGLAVYSPNPSRLLKVALRPESPSDLKNGKIVVTFSETQDAGGKLLSQASLDLQ